MFKVDAGDFLFGGADASAMSVESSPRAIDQVKLVKLGECRCDSKERCMTFLIALNINDVDQEDAGVVVVLRTSQ
jgi:hypothetical protein